MLLVYHLQCLPGGSLTTYCIERCILYRSSLLIVLVAIKSETVCPLKAQYKYFETFPVVLIEHVIVRVSRAKL